jgi:hypothetical protein
VEELNRIHADSAIRNRIRFDSAVRRATSRRHPDFVEPPFYDQVPESSDQSSRRSRLAVAMKRKKISM